MERTPPLGQGRPERVFLDANIIRGELTTDILMSMAANKAIDLRWSDEVMREARDHRPGDLSEEAINHRFDTMNRYLPRGRVTGYEHLMPDMQVKDDDDRHVLAAAVHGNCTTLVTENDRDFKPPATGPHRMRVERLADFLSRKLDEEPTRTRAGLQSMLDRNKEIPRTFPELVDTMAGQQPLNAFARELNNRLPADQRGTAFSSPNRVALDGVEQASQAIERGSSGNQQQARGQEQQPPERGRGPER